jgi:hypothetical protein
MAFGKVWELFLIEEVLMVPNTDGNGVSAQKLQYITPDCRCKCQELYVCLYTYSHVTGPAVLILEAIIKLL